MVTLRFALAAATALLLNWPTFGADVNAALERDTIVAGSSTLLSANAPDWASASSVVSMTPPSDASPAPAFESGTPALNPGLPASETSPVIAPGQPPAEEHVVEALEAPPTAKYADLWERIRAGFGLPKIDSPLVARHARWYLNRPEYVQRMVERSHRYLYFIIEELEKRNMPTEIALLPMIESAYNPQAYSTARAAGIWQFIPSTGRKYGLQQDFWYDGRRDVLAATRAALDYLQFLHDMFGDWELALAAYNWGENGVQRAISNNRAQHKATNYASLKMPKETRNYLPKLQAVKNIIANPKLLGLELETIPNQPYFAVVKPLGPIDVIKAAQLADMPVDEFRLLNPGYNRPVIIQAAARHIVLPIDKVDEFHANLERNGDPLVTWQTYTLKKGETLNNVANKFGTTGTRLRDVNGFDRRNHIRPGQMLLVPFASEDGAINLNETYTSTDFQVSPVAYDAARIYRVRNGDTLPSIARKHHLTVARIKAANAPNSNQLHAGQHLVLYDDARPERRSRHRHPHRINSN
jgi:peptidoglycan lytic transglycosylase D